MQTAEGRANSCMSPDEFRVYAAMQVEEINKYKWCLGVELGHDPLQDRCLNDIAREWIERYAADFRRRWIRKACGCPN
jgi:hypothetical protein